MARFAMAISLNQLLIHSRNTYKLYKCTRGFMFYQRHCYTLCGKSLSRAWSDQPLDLLGHVNKVAAPDKDRGVGAGIYPPKHRGMGNKCAEISHTCKHRDHTFISPRPAGTFNKQNTLLLHCYSALAAATSWKISDEEDKNISYKLYPGSRGAGRRELDCRVVLTSPRTAPSTTAAAHGKISRSRIEIN